MQKNIAANQTLIIKVMRTLGIKRHQAPQLLKNGSHHCVQVQHFDLKLPSIFKSSKCLSCCLSNGPVTDYMNSI